MRVLIIGCGYLGTVLARHLVHAGHVVEGIRRSPGPYPDLAAAGVLGLTADITQPSDLGRLDRSHDWVVLAVSSGRGADASRYAEVYREGTRNVLHWLNGGPVQKFACISSTSVYGQCDGSVVTEDSPAQPSTATGRVLVEAERLILSADPPGMVLRASGLYGAGRGHLFQQYLVGEAVMHGQGDRYLNMIHVEDAAGAIAAALERGRPGEIYNVSDNEPVTERLFFAWLAGQLGGEMPPADDGSRPRKRGFSSKQVSNRKLRGTVRYDLVFPTFREGYDAEIERVKKGSP